MTLNDLYLMNAIKFLCWQGGTIHQVKTELQKNLVSLSMDADKLRQSGDFIGASSLEDKMIESLEHLELLQSI